MDEEIKLEVDNGTVKVIQIQEESDYEEELDGRIISEEIIARYHREIQDSKEENAILIQNSRINQRLRSKLRKRCWLHRMVLKMCLRR